MQRNRFFLPSQEALTGSVLSTNFSSHCFNVAEFFAGIGLVRHALEKSSYFRVKFSNDIAAKKLRIYAQNFSSEEFVLQDIHNIKGNDVPSVDLATASFPCTDLSVAGMRDGLDGRASKTFWEFIRILREMKNKRPSIVLIENVVGFSTSRGGSDLKTSIASLNALDYVCDMFVVDAKRFVPQSRPRLFLIGVKEGLCLPSNNSSNLRPLWISKFVKSNPDLKIQHFDLPNGPSHQVSLRKVIKSSSVSESLWWSTSKTRLFLSNMEMEQRKKLQSIVNRNGYTYATAYRRTRRGKAVWELRYDDISGCLRTATGGSSKQAIVEAGNKHFRIRWMHSSEYAALQGAPSLLLTGISESTALFGLGDAVCVPVVKWIAKNYILPILLKKSVTRSPGGAA